MEENEKEKMSEETKEDGMSIEEEMNLLFSGSGMVSKETFIHNGKEYPCTYNRAMLSKEEANLLKEHLIMVGYDDVNVIPTDRKTVINATKDNVEKDREDPSIITRMAYDSLEQQSKSMDQTVNMILFVGITTMAITIWCIIRL